ncbi:hypothetical protein J6590_101309 [Homalodisca vitripennis]|nr:hypothetical protein J6590_101309 [Homalodisca vitripennis]
MFDGKVVQVVTDTSSSEKQNSYFGGCLYPPQICPVVYYEKYCAAVLKVVAKNLPESDLLLLGDFKQPNTTWENLSMCTPAYSSQCTIDLSNLLHLHQCNQVRNYRGVILDLVPTTISDTTVFPAIETIVPIDVNHPLLAFCISLQKIDIPLNPTPCRSLKKCDLGAVWEWIQRQNHPTISSCNVI